MDAKEESKRIIKSSKRALKELDKVINQNIELMELDPERTKQVVQGKIEAIEGSFKILNLIQEEEEKLIENKDGKEKKDFFGVENRARKNG